MPRDREMALIAFMQAQNCSNYVGSWRAAGSASDFTTPEYYQRIAHTLEGACFDMAFFDDRLAMPDIYGHSHELAVKYGIRSVKMDPIAVLSTMAAVTTRLGLGATSSTTYYEPFHVARQFATMDLMTRGRMAWNIVTSLNSSEAANFGRADHIEHDLRYDRADEFLEIVTSMWSAWQADAIVLDKDSGTFADPAKVHRTNYDGKFFQIDGTFPVPPSPQGHPVLMQAGSSGRGTDFAARWADLIFVGIDDMERGAKRYQALRAAIRNADRDPDKVTVAPLVSVVVAETEELVEQKLDLITGLAREEDSLLLLCEVLNVDLSDRPYDEPFTDSELAAMSWHGLRERVIDLSGKSNPSLRDFVVLSGRGEFHRNGAFVGTPEQVADQIEEWLDTCCDGFVLSATEVPGSYEDFARYVTPLLQRRGLAKTSYSADTLRGHLGLDVPGLTAR